MLPIVQDALPITLSCWAMPVKRREKLDGSGQHAAFFPVKWNAFPNGRRTEARLPALVTRKFSMMKRQSLSLSNPLALLSTMVTA
jgi:hypothetical protein